MKPYQRIRKSLLKPLLLFMFLFLTGIGCAGNPTDEYTDSLTIGTGLARGTVTGAADTFTLPAGADGILLHFALESRYDIGNGLFLGILIEQNVNGTSVERRLFDYEPIDNTDIHYYIDSFYHEWGPGRFTATIVSGYRRVVSKEYTVSY
jgi:hypothetical protein